MLLSGDSAAAPHRRCWTTRLLLCSRAVAVAEVEALLGEVEHLIVGTGEVKTVHDA